MNQIWLNAVRASARAAVPWWLAGGAPTPVAVYQPLNAASLAASYVNLVNPGTFDAAPGVAPTWDAATGWEFDGATQYLATGIVPSQDRSWSALIRYVRRTGGDRYVFGSRGVPLTVRNRFGINSDAGGNIGYFNNGSRFSSPSEIVSVISGFAGSQAYRNGLADGMAMGAGTATSLPALFIGAENNAGTPEGFSNAVISSVVFYNTTLTAPQVAAVSAAMAAL